MRKAINTLQFVWLFFIVRLHKSNGRIIKLSLSNQKFALNYWIQRSTQVLFFPVVFLGDKTARIASSKICFRPFWVNAEHSRYLAAPTSFANDRPYLNYKVQFKKVQYEIKRMQTIHDHDKVKVSLPVDRWLAPTVSLSIFRYFLCPL